MIFVRITKTNENNYKTLSSKTTFLPRRKSKISHYYCTLHILYHWTLSIYRDGSISLTIMTDIPWVIQKAFKTKTHGRALLLPSQVMATAFIFYVWIFLFGILHQARLKFIAPCSPVSLGSHTRRYRVIFTQRSTFCFAGTFSPLRMTKKSQFVVFSINQFLSTWEQGPSIAFVVSSRFWAGLTL